MSSRQAPGIHVDTGDESQDNTTEHNPERYTREISYTPNFQSIFSNPHMPQPSMSPMPNNSYHNMELYPSQQPMHMLPAHQLMPLNQQQIPNTANHHLQQDHNYMQDPRTQNRLINLPNTSLMQQSSNTLPRVAIIRSNPYQPTQLQQPIQQSIQQPPYSQSISMPQQQPTETLAQTYHNFARRPRCRQPSPNSARQQGQQLNLMPIQQQPPNIDTQAPQIRSPNLPTHLMHHLQSQPIRPLVNVRQTVVHQQPTPPQQNISPAPPVAYNHNVYLTNQSISLHGTYSGTNSNQACEVVQHMPRLNNLLSNTRCSIPTTRLPTIPQRSGSENFDGSANRQLPPDVQCTAEARQLTQVDQTQIRTMYQTNVQQVNQDPYLPQIVTPCTSTTNGTRLDANQTEVLFNNTTPVSVSSTTRALKLVDKQHVGTQINLEVFNKACQFDGRNIMINKSVNAIVNMLDQITQTENEVKPTYVDRACSPILTQHLQHIQPLQPAKMDIPVRRKVTAKRRKVETTTERRTETYDSDTEINILE